MYRKELLSIKQELSMLMEASVTPKTDTLNDIRNYVNAHKGGGKFGILKSVLKTFASKLASGISSLSSKIFGHMESESTNKSDADKTFLKKLYKAATTLLKMITGKIDAIKNTYEKGGIMAFLPYVLVIAASLIIYNAIIGIKYYMETGKNIFKVYGEASRKGYKAAIDKIKSSYSKLWEGGNVLNNVFSFIMSIMSAPITFITEKTKHLEDEHIISFTQEVSGTIVLATAGVFGVYYMFKGDDNE